MALLDAWREKAYQEPDKVKMSKLWQAYFLKEKEIYVYIGYMPLHSAPYGLRLGYKPEDLPITEDLGKRIARLPFYTSLADEGLDYTIENMKKVLVDMYGF